MSIYPGRYAARTGEPVVVFMVGIRFNSLRGLPTALQTFSKMPAMLDELERNPQYGCLSTSVSVVFFGATVTQYWRSLEDLQRFARERDATHLPAWSWFNKRRDDAGVGIWHETFAVAGDASESIYANMPRVGLAAAFDHVALQRGSQPARDGAVALAPEAGA
ncbi:MAG: DUF4188 domain-containing protein [Vulcanimicrobiaceae bacterium]